jgi:hypothetical protein
VLVEQGAGPIVQVVVDGSAVLGHPAGETIGAAAFANLVERTAGGEDRPIAVPRQGTKSERARR